jgi:hypothetical protein
MEAQAFPLVKIHASLVKVGSGPASCAAPIMISSHSTSVHTSHCSNAVHVNPRPSCGVQSRKPPITSHLISMGRLQPLNVEDPFFRIHNLGEMIPTVKRPTADHSPLLFDRTCRASRLHDAASKCRLEAFVCFPSSFRRHDN